MRDPTQTGEIIVFITKAFYQKHFIQKDIDEGDLPDLEPPGEDDDDDDADDDNPPSRAPSINDDDDDPPATAMPSRDRAADDDTAEDMPTKKSRGKKAVSALQARDHKFLIEFLVTKKCRRIPWNKFFDNDNKCKPFTA